MAAFGRGKHAQSQTPRARTASQDGVGPMPTSDSPVLDHGQREDRWICEWACTTKSWPDVPSPWVCGCGAKWVLESDEERAITAPPLTSGLPSSSLAIAPFLPTDALALQQQQQHQPQQPQQPPYRPIFATFSDSELEGLARDVDAEQSRRQGGQPRWRASNIQMSRQDLFQQAQWDFAARQTLRAERRRQGARMVTQRMQLEEDFLLQQTQILQEEREGRRQAEASLQEAQQELAQLWRHLDRGDGMIDAVRLTSSPQEEAGVPVYYEVVGAWALSNRQR